MAEYISRDKLLSERMKSKYYHLSNGDTAIPIIDIEHAQTEDVAPVVHAKWIDTECETCSVCGYVIEGDHELDFNYCPNCGAKMDKEVE